MSLPTCTIDDLLSWEPCYGKARTREMCAPLPERFTALDVLRLLPDVSVEDRFWAVLRPEMISDRTLRLFACWCARQALALVARPDPRSVAAVEVAERYACGEATDEELDAAWAAAWAGASAAAWAAAWAAPGAVAGAAAWEAARAAQIARLIETLIDDDRREP